MPGSPKSGVLVLSQHLEARYALRVTDASPARTGYLLKERVTDSRVLFEALEVGIALEQIHRLTVLRAQHTLVTSPVKRPPGS